MTVSIQVDLDPYIGKYISTYRPRTPMEVEAFGPGEEGGAGVLESVWISPLKLMTRMDGPVEDHGLVPWIDVDWGMGWPILPGTTISIYESEADFLDTKPPLMRAVVAE